MFCSALTLAPDRIARLAAVCRNSWSLKSAGSPASVSALAHHRRRALLARIHPPAESANTRSLSAPGVSIRATVAGRATVRSLPFLGVPTTARPPTNVLRKSLTKLEAAGHVPSAIVLTPGDFETIELALASTEAIEHLSLPFDPAKRQLYGVSVVVTVAQSAGAATVLAEGAAGLDTDRQGVGVQWSETSNTDDWSKNLIRARCKGRFATSVFAPLGVVQADLTA